MVPKKFFKLFRRFGSVIEVPEFSKLFSINKIHSKLPPYNSLPPGIQENYHIARFFIWISIWSLFDKIVTWNLFLIFFLFLFISRKNIFHPRSAIFHWGALSLNQSNCRNQIILFELIMNLLFTSEFSLQKNIRHVQQRQFICFVELKINLIFQKTDSGW